MSKLHITSKLSKREKLADLKKQIKALEEELRV